MAISEILKEKLILAVDDEEDVLDIIEEELNETAECTLHKATTFERAQQYLVSYTYDLVILDIMGVRGFDLLNASVSLGFPTVMLTAHALNKEALKKSIEMGARAYLPKEKMAEIAPFLEQVLSLSYRPGWKYVFEKLGGFFNAQFGPGWQKKEKDFWEAVASGQFEHEPVILKK